MRAEDNLTGGASGGGNSSRSEFMQLLHSFTTLYDAVQL